MRKRTLFGVVVSIVFASAVLVSPLAPPASAAPAKPRVAEVTKVAKVKGLSNRVRSASGTAVATPYIIAGPDQVVGEAAGPISLPVTLSAPGTSKVTVAFNLGAGGGCNYLISGVTSGTLTFAPGTVTESVPITINNCKLATTNFHLTLSGATNGVIARANTQVEVVGDNTLQSTPGLYARGTVVDTTAGSVQVPVLLGGPNGAISASTVTVKYTTTNGSAVAGTDYTTTSGTLTFGPGQTVENITIPIINRTTAAVTRSFSVTLSSPTNATIIEGTGVVTIGASGGKTVSSPSILAPPNAVVGEADGWIDLPVTLSAPSNNLVTVAYTLGAGGGCNYVISGVTGGTLYFLPGEVLQDVRVMVNDCKLATTNFHLTLSGATNGVIAETNTQVDMVGDNTLQSTPGLYARGTVVDTTAGSVQVPVLLGGPNGAISASTVTVKYTTTNGSAVAGTDYTTTSGTLTFGPGQTVENITIPIINRTTAAVTRSFSVTLSSPTNATIIEGTGVVTIGASGGKTVSSPSILAPPNAVVGEADGWIDLPVTLSAPSNNLVTVAYTLGAGGGCNYVISGVTGGTLYFLPGEVLQDVRVMVNDCKLATTNFHLTLSGATNGVIAETNTQVDMVGDNTLQSTPGLYARGTVVDTTAGSVQVPVLLGGPNGAISASTVTVKYTTTNGSAVAGTDYTTTSGTLTFGPGQTVENITIPIINRTTAAVTRSFSVTLSSPTNATIIEGTGVVTIGASGGKTVSSPSILAPPNAVVGEADGWIDLPVTLSAPSNNLVTVAYTLGAGGGCNYVISGVTGGTLYFLPGEVLQDVRVMVNDCGFTTNQTFNLTLSAPTDASLGRATTTVTVSGPPTTSVLYPAKGAALSGSTWLDASASNATSVQFWLFLGSYGLTLHPVGTATLTDYGWLYYWNTKTVPKGSYVLLSEAFNSSGDSAFSPLTTVITVSN